MKVLNTRVHGDNVPSADAATDLQTAPRALEGGARRTWWEISAELQIRESNHTGVAQKAMSAQAIKDTHDRALAKIRALLGDNFRLQA
jgi:hypothetical protein